MADPTRGITCPDMRRVVREALAAGWEWSGWSGTTHARILWPATGETLGFGSTPSVASWKTLATEVKRVSGVEVWRKGNRKRSRKNFGVSDADREADRIAEREYRQGIRDEHQERVQREQDIRATAAAERRRREIEELMR